jgi:hypothetical protein
MPPEADPATPPPAAPPAVAPPAAPPAPPPADGETEPAVAPKWLGMRLDQTRRSTLKKLGFDTEEQAQARLTRAKELEDQEEARKQAAMTELDREKALRTKAETDLATEKRAREQADAQARLVAACAESGVKNVAYAQYLLGEARKADPTLTEAAALANFLKDDAQRAALGLPPIAPAPNPLNTAPPLPNQAPPPGPGGAPPGFDASKATPAEWADWRKRNGIT